MRVLPAGAAPEVMLHYSTGVEIPVRWGQHCIINHSLEALSSHPHHVPRPGEPSFEGHGLQDSRLNPEQQNTLSSV